MKEMSPVLVIAPWKE